MTETRPCPSCGSPLAPGARFCSSCGTPVSLSHVTNDERRVVTVLFADIVGFTGLAERLDPEQVKLLIDGAFEQLVDDVHAFGGRVDKVLGDGILALFGAPVAHEDDAERAVRAALRMQESLAAYVARRVGSVGAVPLQMRIGINTGEVLVGMIAGSDYTAMGDVVNTASRIQAEAPPGGVLVGEATHTLTAAAISYVEPRQLLPRGRETAITVWLAQHALTPPGSRHRRHDLHLVGRWAEMNLIDAALQLSSSDSRCLLLNLIGDSGVGKTRLLDEVISRLEDHVMLLEGVCAPYGESNVWSPIAQAVSAHLGLDPSFSVEQITAAATTKVASMFAVEPTAPVAVQAVQVFLHLLGHPSELDSLDPAHVRDAVHRSVAKVIERRSEKGPVVLWIDDLHWADQTVVELLTHLVVTCGRLPFVIITSMRPGTEVFWPPVVERSTVVSINLQPLAREESDELALELLNETLDGADADRGLLESLYDRSGGNPLFLQELAALVAEEGPTSELPESLRALIAARLDQLTFAERQTLDNAATLGLSGHLVGLEHFAAAMQQPYDESIVTSLEAKGYLRLQGRRWEFRSDSVRDAAYQMLTKTARAQRHAGVMASMAERTPTYFDDLAFHAATAAELVSELGPIPGVPDTIREDAIRYLAAAAQRARETGSQRLVIRHATRAIGLLSEEPRDEPELLQLMLVRAAALVEMREFASARVDVETVLEQSVARRDQVLEGEARSLLGSIHHLEGDRERARAELGRSVELLRASGARVLLAGALRQRGFIELFGGSIVDAEWFFGEAEAEYVALGDERGLAYVEQYRAWLSFLTGELDLADQRLHHAAETFNRVGDRNGVGWAFGLLAFVRFFQRRFAEAEDLAQIVRADAADRSDEWADAMMATLVSNLRLWSGHLEESVALAEQARNRFRRLGDRFGLVQALSALVRGQVALGRDAAVQRSSEELLSLAGASPLGPMPVLAVAGAAMHRGDGQAALSLAERAISEMEDMATGAFEASVIRSIALAQLGRLDEAVAETELLDDDPRSHPFARVASALVHSLAGDAEVALHAASTALDTSGATYLDRALAATASAGAHAALGNADGARVALSCAIDEVTGVGDVIAMSLLRRSFLHVVGEPHESGAGDATVLGQGWLNVVEALPTLDPVA